MDSSNSALALTDPLSRTIHSTISGPFAFAVAIASAKTAARWSGEVAAQARWSDRVQAEADDATEIFAAAYGWTAAVAEIVGLSPRAIRLDLELHRGLKPEVAEALRSLPVGKNASQLRALAKMPEGDQRQVAGLIVEGQASGVTEAQAILRQAPVKSAEQKAVSAVLGNWARISPAQQKALLRTLSMPKGVTLMIDGEAVDA